ncbi:MAG TPA: ROK family protein [Bacteroidales bacterium]|nr:ROK family protein [Bacteroidales bacterium]
MTKNTESHNNVVMTLDAGGTNFVFSALQGVNELVKPITKPSFPEDLEKCISSIIHGFEEVKKMISVEPTAISFAFPGPADYELGIIENLPNFPAFKGGVPLGPILENQFKIPVFINNDGNLFAYGEALHGILPNINRKLEKAGSVKRYRNLIGFTLGTGFGGGIVIDNKLLVGDSSCGAEIHNTMNKFNPDWNAEESVSTRAVRRVYAARAGISMDESPMPRDIAEIARGSRSGDRDAALSSFSEFGEGLGSSIANTLSLIDSIVVLGGGITAAWDLFARDMFREINRKYKDYKGNLSDRLSFRVYDLEDEKSFPEFAGGHTAVINIPGTDKTISYDDAPRTGVGISALTASRAIAMGAYAFAMQKLDEHDE